jgi:hypothetical protein
MSASPVKVATSAMMKSAPAMIAIFRVEFIFSLLVVIDFGVNKPPTPVAVFLFVPWGLYLVVFIFSLLVFCG